MTGTGDFQPMQPPPVTCEQVDREDLDTRYLRGVLDSPQAEAFEAHFFGCDRCWGLVQGGNALRAARLAPPVRWMRARPWLLAATAVVIGVVGISLLRTSRPGAPVSPETERSGVGSLGAPRAGIEGPLLTLAWPRVPDAGSFRVRLYRGDGSVLLEREVTDTSFRMARDSLGPLPPVLMWQVQALDRLGAVLRRFPLIEVRP